MNKISFIIEFDEVSKIKEEQLTEFIEKTGIKFHVLESDNDLKKYKKYKEVIDKVSTRLEYFLIGNLKYKSSQKEFIKLLNILKEVE